MRVLIRRSILVGSALLFFLSAQPKEAEAMPLCQIGCFVRATMFLVYFQASPAFCAGFMEGCVTGCQLKL